MKTNNRWLRINPFFAIEKDRERGAERERGNEGGIAACVPAAY